MTAELTPRQWVEANVRGLSMLFETASDGEAMGRAVEAFLEVARLSGEINREEGPRILQRGEEGRHNSITGGAND